MQLKCLCRLKGNDHGLLNSRFGLLFQCILSCCLNNPWLLTYTTGVRGTVSRKMSCSGTQHQLCGQAWTINPVATSTCMFWNKKKESISINVPGHSIKYQRLIGHWFNEAFVGLVKGPSSPPSIHWPKPVSEPSSHHPHPGKVWQSSQVFIPEQLTA